LVVCQHCGVIILILCPNCMRFFVGDYSVYAPKRIDLASTIRKRTYCPHCGYVFTGNVRLRKRLSKDDWLRIVMDSIDAIRRNGIDPLQLLTKIGELKDRGVSDSTILIILS